ncbi:MAG: hypothetical protein K2I81_02615 [Alphaproteobacteria bacterium]|nr:hypothetical protein [Alphaproteobacteria bacterium]
MKSLFVMASCLAYAGMALGAEMCVISNMPMNDGTTVYIYDDSCKPSSDDSGDFLVISACDMCAGKTTTSGGITTVRAAGKVTGSFPSGGGLVRCTCSPGTVSYKCASGYYGTATSAQSGCTACPGNATCSGGNGSVFRCNVGYYKNGTSCTRCPASGGVYGTTAGAGATSVTECYLPSGTAFSDASGSGTYEGNCYYSN